MEPNVSHTSDLDNFIDFLYDGLQGYVYLAAKDPQTSAWKQEFFEYPAQVAKLKHVIRAASKSYEIYIGPALYTDAVLSSTGTEKAVRENFKCSNVVWADFDGNAPDWNEYEYQPSLVVQTSEDHNQHAYWLLEEPVTTVSVLDDLNRRIAYGLQADNGSWDAIQVLRPPETLNHKTEAPKPVYTVRQADIRYDNTLFESFGPSPEEITTDWNLGSLPDVQDVILKYAFPPDVMLVLKKERNEVKDRSASLMNLAYSLCEMGLSDAEVFVVLALANDRWGKFTTPERKNKQLSHIITVARNKYPDQESDDEEAFTLALDYESFLNTEINIDWLIEPMLMEQGSMLLVGPSGVGKTQISIQFMVHLALGKDYLHYKIPKPKKVAFFSLEMDHGSLKIFMEAVDKGLTQPEKAVLAENFIIIPHGEPWPLNTTMGQEYFLQVLEAVQPDVVFVDSIGSAIKGSISGDETVQPLLDFNDRIRKKYKVALWYIHHVRKAPQGNTHYTSQDDIYGNQYLLNRSTSAYGVLHGKQGKIKIRNFKLRLAKMEDDYLIERTENLNFQKVTKVIDEKLENITFKQDTDDDNKAPGGFDL